MSLVVTNPIYKTSNSHYGTGWIIHQGQLAQTGSRTLDVPTYNEVVSNLPEYKKTTKLLKNQLVANQFSQEYQRTQESLAQDEIQRAMLKLDKNKIASKPFPVKHEEYKIPGPGLQNSQLYKLSNQAYGSLHPTNAEITEKYYPRSTEFTTGFNGGMNRFNGLNASVCMSKVHEKLNEFY